MSDDSFAYNGYKDRVQVEKIPQRTNHKRQEVVTGRPEDVMLYVADRLRENVVRAYEHMAWNIATILVDSQKKGKWPQIKVVLNKSDYAGD